MSKAGGVHGESLFEGYELLTFEWVLFGITTPLVATRLYVQLRFRYRPWREIFVIIAWLLYIVKTVGHQLLNNYHWFGFHGVDFYTESNPYAIPVLKLNFLSMLTFKVSIYMCKFALLYFYLDLTPRRTCAVTWWTTVVTIYLCAVGVLTQIGFTCLLCRPISNFWGLKTYHCMDIAWFYVFSWALFLFTDLLVYIIPFFIIRNLKFLQPSQKRAAYYMFTLGLLNIVSACLMLACYIVPGFLHSDPKGNQLLNAVYSFALPFQQGTAIIIICLPQVRRFILGMSQEKMKRQMDEKMGKMTTQQDDDIEQGLTRGNTMEVFRRSSELTVAADISANVDVLQGARPDEIERPVAAHIRKGADDEVTLAASSPSPSRSPSISK